jgi:hypothetical protein
MTRKILFAALVLVLGCKDRFDSPVPIQPTGYLVVEGVVNNGGGTTNIKLSRTVSLGDLQTIKELGALIHLEDSNNNSLAFWETGDGVYSIDNLHLDSLTKYRLSIRTTNNEEYLSDFVAVRNNPPIDSISWVRGEKGVEIFVNTNDPLNNTRYYQWEYEETWEFHSTFASSLKYVTSGGQNVGVMFREPSDPEIYTCWQFNPSTAILLGSSAKLAKDVIHLPLTLVPGADWKMSVLYSINVRQYSWTKEGFEFLGRMKKNTESLGSVFDPQPSELNGNIHCVSNPTQPVIGFFNISPVREQRIFISNSQLPGWNYRTNCQTVVVQNNKDSITAAFGKLPTTIEKMGAFGYIISFYASADICVDCTISGTNVKPAYWP